MNTKIKAVVFDTNFIIAHINDLKEINSKLCEKGYTPFITQISITERLSQKYIQFEKDFNDLEKLKGKYRRIATIKEKSSFDEYFKKEEEFTIQGYKDEFPQQIIPFNPKESTLSEIMDRVFKKIPPFLNVSGSSDKGFKDTLLWFSLLDYFSANKDQHENVIFITEDGGFTKEDNNIRLCIEFEERTNIQLSIHKNSYYLELTGEQENDSTPQTIKKSKMRLDDSDKNMIREKIEKCTYNIMWIDVQDNYGNYDELRSFSSNAKFDDLYFENIFYSLSDELEKFIFQSHIPVSAIFSLDERVTDHYQISIEHFEALNELYRDVQENYCEYLKQFYIAIANKFNQFYQAPILETDDDLPF